MACLHTKLENFSWAVLSTAQENITFSATFAARAKRAVNNYCYTCAALLGPSSQLKV
jgi:hypothetical protein